MLGTFHFAGSRDLLSLKVDDLTSEKRQKEIQELVDALKAFKPTKVLIEYPFGRTRIDSVYQTYRNGKHTLSINEIQQVGFRLANQLGHEHIYPADHRQDLPFNELMAFLQSTNQMEGFNALIQEMQKTVMLPLQEYYNNHNLKSFFVYMNSDESDAMNRAAYLQHFNKYNSDESDIGTRITSIWWERNFRIMSNIDRITEPGDRLLVIFGQGHTSLLKPFYQDRTDVEYVDVLEFLRE